MRGDSGDLGICLDLNSEEPTSSNPRAVYGVRAKLLGDDGSDDQSGKAGCTEIGITPDVHQFDFFKLMSLLSCDTTPDTHLTHPP